MRIEPAFMKQLRVTRSADPSKSALAEFKVGVRSMPCLADHGFHDMTVLPGSIYLEMALCLHVNLFQQVPASLGNVKFQNPVILTEEDTAI